MSKNTQLDTPLVHAAVSAIIDRGCEFEGKLCFHGTVRIGGVFRGEIYTPDTLIISEGAHVYANIEAGVIIINGEVHGNLQAKYRIEMYPPAVFFQGSVLTPSLSIEKGVIFDGVCKMVPALEIEKKLSE